ncbi:MAG: caspase family protein [Pseudomonadota bacterium]
MEKIIVTAMRRYNKKGVNMMVLDACRNSPKGFVKNYQEGKGSNPGGFVNMDSSGIFIAYSTALGRTSYGASDIRNSIYTAKLLEVLKEKTFWSKNITEVFPKNLFNKNNILILSVIFSTGAMPLFLYCKHKDLFDGASMQKKSDFFKK